MGARQKTKQMDARENGLLLLVSGLRAFVCVALHKEKAKTIVKHTSFQQLLYSWTNGSVVCVLEVGEISKNEIKPGIQWIFCILTLRNDNYGDAGNAKYAPFFVYSPSSSFYPLYILPLAPN